MITEDYVSFEVARLLKEKGFPQGTFRCHYIIDGNIHYKSFENRCGFGDYDIIAPTLVMAMKWLREVHNIIIIIEPHMYDYINEKTSSYVFAIWEGDNYIEIYSENSELRGISYLTYEEAVEAAIKYCLENLI